MEVHKEIAANALNRVAALHEVPNWSESLARLLEKASENESGGAHLSAN